MINMGELTLAQAKAGHRALWDWLAETGSDIKAAWPGWAEYDRMAMSYCFVCECHRTYVGPCHVRCPAVWPGGAGCCETAGNDDGVFELWRAERNINARRELAAQIRDLPWREDAQ